MIAAGLLFASARAFAAGYAELKSATLRGCRDIDPSEYHSGLIFNPDGYRSFYVRSECFQKAAVQFRDGTLCGEVRQRRALFSSSWAIAPKRCQRLVAEGIAADQRSLEDIRRSYLKGPVRLRDFRIERNGNGRDFDIIPSFSGEFAHGYRLVFEILPGKPGAAPILLHAAGHYLDGDSNLSLFVRQDELRRRFAQWAPAQPHAVRATLTLDVGFGGQSGYWSEEFIERIFPVAQRTQTLTRTARF